MGLTGRFFVRLPYISSSSVYYRPEHQYDITEETALPKRAVNRYAATKRDAEQLVRGYSGRWVVLRPRAVFGPRDTVLLPRILEAFHTLFLPRREPAITRFGVHVFRYSKTFDVSKAKEALGEPRTSMDESLQRTVDWFRERGRFARVRAEDLLTSGAIRNDREGAALHTRVRAREGRLAQRR